MHLELYSFCIRGDNVQDFSLLVLQLAALWRPSVWKPAACLALLKSVTQSFGQHPSQ
jgi:hypothetical protein